MPEGQDDLLLAWLRPEPEPGTPARRPELRAVKERVRARLVDVDVEPERVAEALEALLAEETLGAGEREALRQELLREIQGLGVLEPLLEDPEVGEIMVNGPDTVYVERRGRIVRADVRFRDARHLRQVIERIAIRAGRRVDEASPLLDARLPDGSRANVVLTPIARFGDALTIRKFPRGGLTVADLVARGTVSAHVAAFLEAAVRGRLNLVVSGGTSSGKTTTLNALSAFIPEGERIVTIEDAAELRLQQAHVVSLEARPPNAEGAGEITIRQLVRNALRMRPDRIVVGEVRGGEALDMLQAMNTGHEGSLTTAHANSPRDLVLRLETMVLMAGVDLPLLAVRQQIASALHLIVHQERMGDGVRRITSVMEVTGLEEGVVAMQPIYTFVQEGAARAGDPIAGRWQWSGVRPRCEARLRQLGIDFRFEDDPGAPALGRRGGEEALW